MDVLGLVLIVGGIVVNQILGPVLFRWSLGRCGEQNLPAPILQFRHSVLQLGSFRLVRICYVPKR